MVLMVGCVCRGSVYSEALLTYHALDALDKGLLHAALTLLVRSEHTALPVVLLYLTRAARECKARKREAMLVAVRAITPPKQPTHDNNQAQRYAGRNMLCTVTMLGSVAGEAEVCDWVCGRQVESGGGPWSAL